MKKQIRKSGKLAPKFLLLNFNVPVIAGSFQGVNFVEIINNCIPDFISNCGMARVFGYLMGDNVSLSDKAIFDDTSNTIKQALEKCYELRKDKLLLTKTAYEISLKQLV